MTTTERPQTPILLPDTSGEQFRRLLIDSGFKPSEVEDLPHEVKLRLALLLQESSVIINQQRSIQRMGPIFDRLKFTVEEQRAYSMATLLSDIGKSGPPSATTDQQYAILLTFGRKFHGDPDEQRAAKLHDFVRDEDLESLWLGLDGMPADVSLKTLSVRDFFELHATWTEQLLVPCEGKLPQETLDAARRHHQLDGYPPKVLSENLTRVDKLLIIADKYDAFRCRPPSHSHEETIRRLRKDIVGKALGGRYADDQEFHAIIDAFEIEMGAEYC